MNKVFNGLTPYERLYECPPTYEHLHVFGSLCYAHNQTHKGDKFAPRSRKCVFVGYPNGKKSWSLCDLEKNNFFVLRDVVFCETEFPFHDLDKQRNQEDDVDGLALWAPISYPIIYEGPIYQQKQIGPSPAQTTKVQPSTDLETAIASSSTSNSGTNNIPSTPIIPNHELEIEPTVVIDNPPGIMDRGHRKRMPPVTFCNFVTNGASIATADTGAGYSSATSLYPISSYITSSPFATKHQAFQAAIIKMIEPKLYRHDVAN